MDWSEERIRKETGWKAFREGQAIARHGKVAGFKRGESLLTGAFKEGRRTIRTVARTGDVLSVECGCAINRESGEICSHGVALLLTAIAEAPAEIEEAPEPVLDGELIASAVRLPESLGNMLSTGRLSAQIDRHQSDPDQADAIFSMWLARNAPGGKFPKLLSLSPDQVEEFLAALAGHQRVSAGSKRVLVSEDRLPPLRLSQSEHRGNRVILSLAASADLAPIRWGKTLGAAASSKEAWLLGRLPVDAPSLVWRDEAAELISSGELELSQDEFLENADAWLDLFQSPLPGWLGRLRFEPAVPQFSLKLEGSLNALDARAEFSYLGLEAQALSANLSVAPGLPKLDGEGVLRMRDSAGEQRGVQRLIKAGFAEGSRRGEFVLRDPDKVLAFLADDLPTLQRAWKVTLGDRLSHVLKSLHVIRPKLESSQSLAWELSFQTDAGKGVPEQKIREILRSGKRSVKTSNGATVAISREIPEVIEPLMADLGIVTREGKIQADRARDILFRTYRRNNQDGLIANEKEEIERVRIPDDLNADLRDYQQVGFSWLVDRLSTLSGALLADEMGLGKTIQTLASVIALKQAGSASTLILVPTSLLGNWQDEIQRFAPKLSFVALHGSGRDKLRDEALKADIILTSYGTMCRDLAFHLKQDYDLLVVDEASLLRNPDSEVSRAVAKLNAQKRLALTGTPVENRLRDLWSIFRVVAPGYLGSKAEFEERYQSGDAADPGLHDRLRLRISPFVLRRTKAEVAKDLPEKIEIDEWLDLDKDTRQTYAAIAKAGLLEIEEMEAKSGGGRMHLLTLLLRLRQLCLDSRLIDDEAKEGAKTQRLIEILSERHQSGGKTLVFSQFRKYLGLIRNSKELADSKVFSLDGSTRNRGELVREFQAHDGPAVFLISLKAGGYGLNLTAADTVIHMDPWWNPAVEAQASDRAHRIGQTQPVTIYKLLTRDSVEERVRRLQASKQGVIDSISGDAAPANWNEADFRSLLD
ncbi:SNF2-related protein [Haloferula chungangensis]|uniref:SNF2-related protein n=1 Tax=Haloferula chungangensis TaxID=1048331 RepID=A0ABW2L3P8_9BACT